MIKASCSLLLFLFSSIRGEEVLGGDKDCKILVDSYERAAMMSRNYLAGLSNRWPNGVVPYVISDSFSLSQKRVIQGAMIHISERTCVKFVERTTQRNYVDIYTGDRGCFATLGYNSRRIRSLVHLQSNNCVFNGIVIHELLHVLGFGHEQTRPDRDEYVQINWRNIRSGTQGNFWRNLGENEETNLPACGRVTIDEYDNCYSGARASTFGVDYDYGSIMHYGLYDFSINGQKTMTLKRSTSIRIPNRSGMSTLDVEKTNYAYECETKSTYEPEKLTYAPEPITFEPEYTTPGPSDCSDSWDRCNEFTRFCGNNRYMNRNCKKTCFNCECRNLLADESCDKLSNYCDVKVVNRFCAKRCQAC